MPYANDELLLEDLTLEYDFVTNMILALDRGQPPVFNENIDPVYVINRLTLRTTKADFPLLPPPIQQSYEMTINQYKQIQADNALKIKQAQSEFIPTGGYLVACDFYVSDSKDPTKSSKRVRVPSEALDWLLKQIEAQGTTQALLATLPEGSVADVASMITQQSSPQQQMGAPQQPQTSGGGFYG
jgi:hypothetical protein